MPEQDKITQRLARLTPAQQELLSKRLQERQLGKGALPAITPGEWQGRVPFSFAQERIWFEQQLVPDSPLYHTPLLLRLHGVVDSGALERALNHILRRHAVLRSRYCSEKGLPVQKIEPDESLELHCKDLSASPDPESEVQRLALQEAWRPFDLQKGPLFRATLFSLAQDRHVLLLGLHHITFDAWSGMVLRRELAVLYNAEQMGNPSPLPELPVQYPDYAAWQRSQMQSQAWQQQLAYWKRQMASPPVPLLLPGEQTPAGARSYHGGIYRSEIPGALLHDLENLALGQKVTLFMLCLAAFQALLYRYSGQTDLVLGTPTAGRSLVEVEELIGVFINTLLLRTRLSGDLPFRRLLAQVRQDALDAYANQDVPFEKLVQELNPPRDWQRTPFFRFMLNFRNLSQAQLPAGDIQIERMDFDPQIAMFDLSLQVISREAAAHLGVGAPAGRILHWVYATEIFTAGFIERLAADYIALLRAIVGDPDCALDDLPLTMNLDQSLISPALTAEQRQQILVEWNRSQVSIPGDGSVVRLFEEQAACTPDALAVISDQPFESLTSWLQSWAHNLGGSPSLSYSALNSCANQLAQQLRKLGIRPDTLVGICLEHSLETVVAIWAVLKAGGAYIPIDPNYPAARVKFMLQDAQMALLISRRAPLEKLGLILRDSQVVLDAGQVRAIILDQSDNDLVQASTANPPVVISPESLAYVIYTSGSTGQPKGAGIPHRALFNHTLWLQSLLKLDHSDRVFFKTPFSFDASVWEYISPLSYGASLLVARPQGQRDPQYLAAAIQSHAISVLQLVPTQLRLLLVEESFRRCSSLRFVLCGGEALTPDLVHRLQAVLPSPALINLYGPSEACIDSLFWVCPPGAAVDVVPIGRPISNGIAHILDRHLQPVPVGVPGELYIGGAGLGRGYINRPELTRRNFIANPLPETLPWSERLYRTGDQVRYLPDGQIEFLGRFDDQVKLRGFRIELGEIERALCAHPHIQQAAVVARQDTPENQSLVAYIVVQPGISMPAPQELRPSVRSFLKERLPEYMLPARVVFLDALPLTPSNKIDRQALPVPELDSKAPVPEYQPLRDEVERKLAHIWEKVLNRSQVGAGDNFFDLGGHSLLAMQLVANISDELQANLPVRVVFEASTLAEMADLIRVFLRQLPTAGTNELNLPIQGRESGEL